MRGEFTVLEGQIMGPNTKAEMNTVTLAKETQVFGKHKALLLPTRVKSKDFQAHRLCLLFIFV